MRAHSLFFWFLLPLALVCAREPVQSNAPLSLEAVRNELSGHANQERFRGAQWGIKVISSRSGAPVFELNADKLLKPASNAKLFTGALALDVLGPDYRIRTSVFANARPVDGVVRGDLIIYGRGDPTFSPTFASLGRSNAFSHLVQAIRDAGIRQIDGDLVGDSTFFSGPPFGSGWTWDDLQYYYGAEVSALSAYDNTVDLTIVPGANPGDACRVTPKVDVAYMSWVNRTRTGPLKSPAALSIERPVGEPRVYIQGTLAKGYGTWVDSVSVPNATLWFVTLLKEELQRAGIVVQGRARSLNYPETTALNRGSVELATVHSLPVSAIVERMLKMSQNLYAQLLLLQVGTLAPENPKATTEERGIEQLRKFARRAGVGAGEMLLDDGAGLSRSGLVTPAALVQLLRFMAEHKSAQLFRHSLPEAGEDGTLRTRLKELKGRLSAKTGTVRYVNTLSGYVTSAAGEEFIFAVMLNAYGPPGGGSGRDDIDLVPRLLGRLSERVTSTGNSQQ